MSTSQSTLRSSNWFSRLASAVDRRSGVRLVRLFVGVIMARGVRTVTSWIRAGNLSDDFRPCYTTVSAAGKAADLIAALLVITVVKPLLAGGERLSFALDDTPTKRYGPEVQGAGIHHNPTPGPAGSSYLYGHVWVTLALLARHSAWGVIALPLLARLYVRKTNLKSIDPWQRPKFRTKLQQAVELLHWAKKWLGILGTPLWVVVDGAYAKAAFLKPMKRLGVTVVSRLAKNAALWTEPDPRRPGQRGRPRLYGKHRMNLAKRAGHRRGWLRGTFVLYGKQVSKRYKTFVALWRPAGGAIRVVLVKESDGWRAFFCTDVTASVADILTQVADRFAIEITFRECKEVVGAGQQQVRHVWANIGAFHLCLWTFTMTEAWAWNRSENGLVDRSASPWDDATRRPSHADKRRAWRREFLDKELCALLRPDADEAKTRAAAQHLLDLAA